MSRYIDAEEAFNLLADAPQAIVPKAIWKVGIRSILDQCNAIDIVRCKDCEWYLNDHLCTQFSKYGTIETEPDDFCSYGEVRDE